MLFDDSDDVSTLFDGAGIHKRWWECDVCEISDDEDNVPLAVERVEDERKHKLFDREEVALKYNTRCIV